MHINGKKIEIIRKKRGLSLRELADNCGITASALSTIERGISNPRPSTTRKICQGLSVNFDDVFSLEQNNAHTDH